jgi:cell division protein FtsQ
MSKGTKISLLLLSLTVLVMAALMSGMIKSDRWKISNVDLKAEFNRVTAEQIRVAIAATTERSFFNIKIEEIRSSILQIPWVQNVSILKKWPNTLIVTVIEHKAVAVWNSDKLLNLDGHIFEVDTLDSVESLPRIYGLDNLSSLILTKYLRFNELFKTTGLDITSATVSPRGGWNLNLSNGINVNLGTLQMDSKIIRLCETWVNLLKQNDQAPEYIDLRYSNGYAVKWREKSNAIQTESVENKGNLNG